MPMEKVWIYLFLHSYEKIVGQSGFFSLVLVTTLREEKLWIKTIFTSLKSDLVLQPAWGGGWFVGCFVLWVFNPLSSHLTPN